MEDEGWGMEGDAAVVVIRANLVIESTIYICPQSVITTFALGFPLLLPRDSIVLTSDIPWTTLPNTT